MAHAAPGELDADVACREAAWNQFLESQPSTGFMQSSWWADFMAARGWDGFGVVFDDGDTIVGGARVLRRAFAPGECFYYVPEGPVISQAETDITEVFEHVIAFIETKRRHDELRVSHLRIEPRWEHLPGCVGGFRQSSGWMEPRNTLCIDLRPPEEAILAQMKPKGRYNVGVARRHGVAITEDTSPEGVADFLRIDRETVARHGLHGSSEEYFRELITRLATLQRGSLFFAEYQGTRVAAAMVIYFGARATYFFGGSLAMHRNVMAPYLLHFEIMKAAKVRGCAWYDLYGIAPTNDPDHRWAGLSAFKRKLGGRDFHFVPTLDWIYDAVAYEHYRAHRASRYERRTRSPSVSRPTEGG